MKKAMYAAALSWLLISCKSDKIPIVKNGYLGMSADEYRRSFDNHYALNTSSSKFIGRLQPAFKNGHLSSLSISINDISDFDTAYTVYELGNDLVEKYGTPLENKETVWAGGISKYFKWKSGALEVVYAYKYDQVAGTSGLLYTGDARVIYKAGDNLK